MPIAVCLTTSCRGECALHRTPPNNCIRIIYLVFLCTSLVVRFTTRFHVCVALTFDFENLFFFHRSFGFYCFFGFYLPIKNTFCEFAMNLMICYFRLPEIYSLTCFYSQSIRFEMHENIWLFQTTKCSNDCRHSEYLLMQNRNSSLFIAHKHCILWLILDETFNNDWKSVEF